MLPEVPGFDRQRAARASVVSNVSLTAFKFVTWRRHGLGQHPLRSAPLGARSGGGGDGLPGRAHVSRSRPTPTTASGTGSSRASPGWPKGLLILVAVVLIAASAIHRLMSRPSRSIDPSLGVLVMGVSAVVNIFVSRMLFRVAKAHRFGGPGGRCLAPAH